MDKKYHRPILAFIEGKMPKNILDIGCGWGNFGDLIKRNFPDIILDGIDIDDKSIDKAYKRSVGEVPVYQTIFKADIRTTNFNYSDYDLYLAFNVFDKMKKKEAMKIINILKGKLLMSLPIITVPQGPQFGNAFTERISFWEHVEILKFSNKCIHKGFIYGVYFV